MHNSLKNNHCLTAAECMPKDELSLAILNERARILAQQKEITENKLDLEMYIEFLLGKNERYGIDYEFAKEVVDNIKLTKIPHCIDIIAGVINHRGALIAVLNLKSYFQIKSRANTQNTAAIIISSQGMTVGLLVDNITGYQFYDAKKLEKPIASEGMIKPGYISGLDKGHTAILNINTIFSDLSLQIENNMNTSRR